jgi:hypothetical protein
MPLYTKEVARNFPRESNGTKKVRYPENTFASSAPASTNLVSGSGSIVPFYLDNGVTGFQAVSNALGNVSGGPWGIKVGIYSADSGIYTASLIETLNLSISGTPNPRTATFVAAGANLGKGWYVLSAFWDGTGGAILNSGNYIVNNAPIIGTTTAQGTYIPSNYEITGLSSSPATLSGVVLSSAVADCPYFFPYY